MDLEIMFKLLSQFIQLESLMYDNVDSLVDELEDVWQHKGYTTGPIIRRSGVLQGGFKGNANREVLSVILRKRPFGIIFKQHSNMWLNNVLGRASDELGLVVEPSTYADGLLLIFYPENAQYAEAIKDVWKTMDDASLQVINQIIIGLLFGYNMRDIRHFNKMQNVSNKVFDSSAIKAKKWLANRGLNH